MKKIILSLRGTVRYRTCDQCHFGIIRYTYLHNSRKHKLNLHDQSSINVPAIPFFFNTATALLKFDYQRADVGFGHLLYKRGCQRLFATVNGRYARIRERNGVRGSRFDPEQRTRPVKVQVVQADGSTTTEEQIQEYTVIIETKASLNRAECYKGWGADVGLFAEYEFAPGLKAGLQASFGAMIGKADTHFCTLNGGLTQRTYRQDPICSPMMDLAFVVSYVFNCSCFSVVTEIGYELQHYFSIRRPLLTTSTQDTQTGPREGVGFAGPFGSIRLRF